MTKSSRENVGARSAFKWIASLCVPVGLAMSTNLVRTQSAQAGGRQFTYTYEATTMPKGAIEYETWYTWKTDKDAEAGYNRHDFRHELEFGITDRFQLALYVSDWRHETSADSSDTEWRDFALETIYQLSDPTTDLLGTAIYGEVKIGDEFLELEGKFIAQKNIGAFTLAYNATLEAEWEGDSFAEDKGAIEQTLGVSYQVSPQFTVGTEFLQEMSIPDWQGVQGKCPMYWGPNLSYRAERWWVTATPLWQVSNLHDEPDFQMRILFGIILTQ